MSVNREELKQLIDSIPEDDAAEVYDFIGYLRLKREREAIDQFDIEQLADDEGLICQVQKSRADRVNGRMYTQEQGLDYLQSKVGEFESESNLF